MSTSGTGFQRNTKQRRLILEELRKSTFHPTATELFAVVRERMPKISLGTVYRNLELLVRNNLALKLEHGGEARFDANIGRHHHVHCSICGRVDDIDGLPVAPIPGEIESRNGYEILACRVEFIGVCPACRKQRVAEENKGVRSGWNKHQPSTED